MNEQPAVHQTDRVIRHVKLARLLHWLMAISVITLLGTAYLPIFGIKFPWVTTHWITGLVLATALLVHIGWSLQWQRLRHMLFWIRDIRDAVMTLAWFFRLKKTGPEKPGKYSPAQKIIHHSFALVVLTSIVSGLLMMVKIDTPLWERNPYWLSNKTWGVIYVVHDLASMILVSMIMLHIYFAIRPEKRLYLRSMFLGWITREEYSSHHDPDQWEK